ncbi:MAG: sulfite exporter TauE/SafE family protein, partial [Desulfobacteraceae bacterium]|nr:sulfite exporter TauE/SafE family protein [Desulfobacteraceae bacterium]
MVDGIVFEYEYNRILGMALFFLLGFLASFLGIGGGSLIVPLLVYLLNFPVAIAAATSQMIVAILTFAATMVHIWIGSFHHGAHRIAALGIGVLTGAQLGAYLSCKIKGKWIIRSLAIAL